MRKPTNAARGSVVRNGTTAACVRGGHLPLGSHGSDTRYVYGCDDDRVDFLERLSSAFWTRDIAVLAYALLGNHYHALVRIPDRRLSEALQPLPRAPRR